jgi:hypothetical protein
VIAVRTSELRYGQRELSRWYEFAQHVIDVTQPFHKAGLLGAGDQAVRDAAKAILAQVRRDATGDFCLRTSCDAERCYPLENAMQPGLWRKGE